MKIKSHRTQPSRDTNGQRTTWNTRPRDGDVGKNGRYVWSDRKRNANTRKTITFYSTPVSTDRCRYVTHSPRRFPTDALFSLLRNAFREKKVGRDIRGCFFLFFTKKKKFEIELLNPSFNRTSNYFDSPPPCILHLKNTFTTPIIVNF